MIISRRDIDFLLYEWLELEAVLSRPHFSEHSRETVDAVLDLGERLARTTFLPHYKDADRHEPALVEGNVRVLPAIRDALAHYAKAGLFGSAFDSELGGWQLPHLVHLASLAQFMAANIATSAYVMLTVANARLIANFGSARQIETFARPEVEGRVLGTMCLSEPQAGSGLGDITTRAIDDGESDLGRRFRLFGNKMWISAGDHDVTENIVHLVLAKVPDVNGCLVEGSKGISLFIVPKLLAGEGAAAVRNDVVVAGLNHKMGYRGTPNCLLALGEGNFRPFGMPGAVGYLIGEIGQGLPIMFHMMNEARIDVGLGAAALACRGYLLSLQYAKERLQGRAKNIRRPAPIISHPDVKRMLLAQKAYAEGALALVLYCARLEDDQLTARREDVRRQAADLLGLLTPVAKTWSSEWGLMANDLAIQVHGGYGYSRDFDVEQLYRDNRLNPIHEGTTGIQGLDLLGRKILKDRARVFALLRERIADTATKAETDAELADCGRFLSAAWDRLGATVRMLLDLGDDGQTLDNATCFLSAFGHATVGWLWLSQGMAAGASREGGAFARGKRRACRYFFDFEMPKIAAWLEPVDALSEVAAAMPPDEF